MVLSLERMKKIIMISFLKFRKGLLKYEVRLTKLLFKVFIFKRRLTNKSFNRELIVNVYIWQKRCSFKGIVLRNKIDLLKSKLDNTGDTNGLVNESKNKI